MPSRDSFCRVFLVWLFRAWAFRFWCQAISSAALANRGLAARRSSHQDRTTALMAMWTWHTVNSGFFFPQRFTRLSQEQQADRTQHQVTFQSHVFSTLIVIQSDLSLVVLKASFDPSAGEGHQQQDFDGGLRRRITDEVLHLGVVQGIGVRPHGRRHTRPHAM